MSRSLTDQVIKDEFGEGSGSFNYTISPWQARSRWYVKAMALEIAASKDVDLESIAQLRIYHPEILSYKAKVLGDCNGTTEFAGWTRFLVAEYGFRESCLSLGCGLGRIEKFLVTLGFTSRFDAFDLSCQSVARAKTYEPRIKALQGDLNFVRLEPESYDFILCHSVLHHLINLEHVLDQVNRALKPGGLLLVSEYVGPTRWQFPKSIFDRLRNMFPGVSFEGPRPWEVYGFESVRSGDLLALIRSYFGSSTLRAVSYGGLYFPFVTCTNPSADIHMSRVVALDAEVSRDGTLPPSYFMGLFGKSHKKSVPATPWSDDELEGRLYPLAPIGPRVIRTLRQSSVAPILRSLKRFLAAGVQA